MKIQPIIEQVDQLAEDRIVRNARIKALEDAMKRAIAKLEDENPLNREPLAVAVYLRRVLDA